MTSFTKLLSLHRLPLFPTRKVKFINSRPLKFRLKVRFIFSTPFNSTSLNEKALAGFRVNNKMAVSISSSMVTGASIASPFTLKPKYLGLSSLLLTPVKPLCYNYCRAASQSRLSSKKSFLIRATVLKEDDEKVVVEDSFDPLSFPGKKEGTSGKQPDEPVPSGFEKWIIKVEQSINILLTDSVIKILDALYHDRDYPRFFVLETIARVPYFAFMSVLHMYESFGWWRRADYLKVHFAESWNEMHHLLIMEELGGNAWWFDRFLAQHIAVFYYFMTAFMYLLSPRMAYHFSECVESHAFETYDKFIKTQGDKLKDFPAPAIAVKYYTEGDLYLFDEFQTARPPNSRRPKIENLYDVFVNVRDDEAEHCKTMKACQTHGSLRSPHSAYAEVIPEEDSECVLPQADCEGIIDCLTKSVKESPVSKSPAE